MKSAVIKTYSGKLIDVFNPQPEDISIQDIAHSLSNLCRYAGHCPEFYSVAQHSILTMEGVSEQYKLQALLHDASEAYCIDLPTPIKNCLPEYREMEEGLMRVIADKFGFEYPLSEEVIRRDKDMYRIETGWFADYQCDGCYLSPKEAKKRFLEAYYSLV